MIHFISSQYSSESVESVMENVNNFINLNDFTNLESSSQAYSITGEYSSLIELARYINSGYTISANRANTIMAAGRFARLKVFIKRVIHKLVGGFLNDVANQQTEFNGAVTRFINQELMAFSKIDQELRRLHSEEKRKIMKECKLPDEWYVEFEDSFRGSYEEIAKRLEKYISIFSDKKLVVDLGCGRGEFLSLLKKNNITAKGTDINETMVKRCQEQNLDVTKMDSLEFLKSQQNESIGGIFASQFVEHISSGNLYCLISKAYEKLEKEGVLLLETVNPLTLGVFCYGFYIDPTHTVPVHPAMLRFMAEKIGFEVEPIQFINEFPEEYKLKTNEDLNAIELENINKINEQLYGAQDYYLVCRKR